MRSTISGLKTDNQDPNIVCSGFYLHTLSLTANDNGTSPSSPLLQRKIIPSLQTPIYAAVTKNLFIAMSSGSSTATLAGGGPRADVRRRMAERGKHRVAPVPAPAKRQYAYVPCPRSEEVGTDLALQLLKHPETEYPDERTPPAYEIKDRGRCKWASLAAAVASASDACYDILRGMRANANFARFFFPVS
ncbi:hypothetical protein EVAR_21859_1 [Eumeta japonica]|uniref:Uncharacterized protein n=1 Tax=Eumeta variegata TaxID=151549 RepID=A0A4C1VB22_EUMVA|nr:hypothetical protein EVAR_21859_1 [Eumeta japonica]